MSAKGTVLFSASEGYDEDMWDDSALIREYDRALQSSRELMRCRKEKSSGKKKRDWKIGDVCRAVFSEDGVEYEGSVVFCNKAKRSVTVRFFGYNNEEEIKERDLMESLGKEEIEAQVEQARLDMEEEEEEEGAGDEYRLGDWCRARWSEDQMVYEATVKSVDRKRGTAQVEFVGFGNVEVKQLDDLYMSKGEERRLEQQEFGGPGDMKEEDIKEEDLQNLLIKNCPDLLANFGGASASDLSFDNLVIDEESKEKKKEKKERKKGKEKKEKVKEASVVKTEPGSAPWSGQFVPPSPFPSLPTPTLPNMFPPQFSAFPPQPQFPGLASPFLPPAPAPQLQSPFQPPSLPHGAAGDGGPASLPPPPALPPQLESSVGPELHSLLLSWYLAGYHTGLYQGVSQTSQTSQTRDKKRSKKK